MAIPVVSFLFLLLALLYAAMVLFLRRGWLRIPFHQIAPDTGPRTYVSILIAARNEEEKIADTIEDILAQTYPQDRYELIVVDDHSTDQTADIVRSYAPRGVKLIQLNRSEVLNSYKKKAISEAINLAKGELIITTDADCRMKRDWLKTIVSYYEANDYKLISSPVVYHEEKSFFETLQTLEFLYLIGLGAASIGNKMPSTCNGANLAYRRDVFFEVGGFKGIDDLASGDDELFMHKVASRYPGSIGFCKAGGALVYTTAKPTLREFIMQRKRWASKSTRYKEKKMVALGVGVWCFNLTLLLSLLIGIFYPFCLQLAILSTIIKMTAEAAFLFPVTKFAQRQRLMYYLPMLTIVHVFYIVYIGIAGNSGKYIWKDRLVR